MSTLTIHFADPSVDPITVDNCSSEFVGPDNDSFQLPSYEGHHDEIVAAIVQVGGGQLHAEFSESLDAHLLFDTRTNAFTVWQGDGDNKSRGYFLNTTHPLVGIAHIDVMHRPEDDD